MRLRLSKSQLQMATAWAILAFVVASWQYLTAPSDDTASSPALPPGVTYYQPHTTDLAWITDKLGPFAPISVQVDSPIPDTHAPALLMLRQNGSTEASTQWQVPFTRAAWSKASAFQVHDPVSRPTGYVTFSTTPLHVYTVAVNQAFFFEEQPQTVFMYDPAGQSWSTTVTLAYSLRQPIRK